MGQNFFLKALLVLPNHYVDENKMPAVPIDYVFSLLYLGIIIAYVCVAFNYKGTRRWAIGIAFLAIYLGFIFVSQLSGVAINYTLNRAADEQTFVILNSVTNLVKLPATYLGFVSVPLMFFSLGRYTAASKEQ